MNDLYTALPFLVYTLIGVILATNYKKWLGEEGYDDPHYSYSIIDFLTMMIFWLPLFFYALLRRK